MITRLGKCTRDYKWVEPENMHLTLNFLGEVDERTTPEVCQAVEEIAADMEPFVISFSGVGAFPSVDQPRVIWVGADEGKDELVELNRLITKVMLDLRIPKDRHQFNPHMTLGRQKRGGRWNDQLIAELHDMSEQNCGATPVQEIVVFSSYLDRFGPTYTPMSRIRL